MEFCKCVGIFIIDKVIWVRAMVAMNSFGSVLVSLYGQYPALDLFVNMPLHKA